MIRRTPKPLPPPTDEERRVAGEAASSLRAAIADPSMMGKRSTVHIDLARPRRGEWHDTWANVPGFCRVNGRYRHTSLPGWEYRRGEILAELIPDLEALAERGERPSEPTNAAGAA